MNVVGDDTTERREVPPVPPNRDVTLRYRWSVATSTGRRAFNEDCWGVDKDRFVVADGVGQGRSGDFASAQAVAGFLTIRVDDGGWTPALQRLDRLIASRALARGSAQAATTLVGVEIRDSSATVLHAGDSRAYLLRKGSIACLTQDHSVGNLRRSQGRDPSRTDDGFGQPRALTEYLGAESPLSDPGGASVELVSKDRLLLCTDGVHEQLSTAAILICLQEPDLQHAVDILVARSDQAGGTDNATALAIEFDDEGAQ